jgi:hypothetical protein
MILIEGLNALKYLSPIRVFKIGEAKLLIKFAIIRGADVRTENNTLAAPDIREASNGRRVIPQVADSNLRSGNFVYC